MMYQAKNSKHKSAKSTHEVIGDEIVLKMWVEGIYFTPYLIMMKVVIDQRLLLESSMPPPTTLQLLVTKNPDGHISETKRKQLSRISWWQKF